MAVVTRADCQQIQASLTVKITWTALQEALTASVVVRDINFNGCQGINKNNDLEDHVKRLVADGLISDDKRVALQKTLVGNQAGNCNAAIVDFLSEQGITQL